MKIKLVNPDYHMREEYTEMMDEWIKEGSSINPKSLITEYYADEEFDAVIRRTNDAALGKGVNYPAFKTFYAKDIATGKLIGAVLIRHYIIKRLYETHGHIGFGVRPCERRKGYATEILSTALDECRRMRMEKVLISCRDDNIGSAKTIEKCGGTLENRIMMEEYDGEKNILIRRYWITL